jgi:hypothetical protein
LIRVSPAAFARAEFDADQRAHGAGTAISLRTITRTAMLDLQHSVATELKLYPSHCRRVTADQRHDLIAEAAYYLAERDGFAAGLELDHWLKAESQIEAKFEGQYYCD